MRKIIYWVHTVGRRFHRRAERGVRLAGHGSGVVRVLRGPRLAGRHPAVPAARVADDGGGFAATPGELPGFPRHPLSTPLAGPSPDPFFPTPSRRSLANPRLPCSPSPL